MINASARRAIYTDFIFFLFAITAYLPTIIAPVLLGGLNQAGEISLTQMAYIGTIELLATGLASMLAPRYFPVSAIRSIGFVAAVISMIVNLVSIKVSGDALMLVRFIAGIADGVLIWTLYEHASRTKNPERILGIFYLVLILVGFVVTLIATNFFVLKFGVHSLFLFFAGLCAVCALLAYSVPNRFGEKYILDDEAIANKRMPVAAMLVVLNVFLFNAFTGLVWIYWAPIAELSGFSGEMSGTMSAVSLAFQLGGIIVSTIIASRVPQFFVSITVHGVAVACIAYAMSAPGQTGFIAFSMVFGFVMYFVSPFAVSLAAMTDPSRRSVTMLAPAIFLGSTFGPLLASVFVSETNVGGGVAVAVVLCAGALIALVLSTVLHHRSVPERNVAAI